MEVRALQRFLPTSQRKLQIVLRLIKDKDVETALNILKFTNKKAARFALKVLKAAIANAKQKTFDFNLQPKDVYVKSAYATSAGMIKQLEPRARGRANIRKKRRGHIFITLEV